MARVFRRNSIGRFSTSGGGGGWTATPMPPIMTPRKRPSRTNRVNPAVNIGRNATPLGPIRARRGSTATSPISDMRRRGRVL